MTKIRCTFTYAPKYRPKGPLGKSITVTIQAESPAAALRIFRRGQKKAEVQP